MLTIIYLFHMKIKMWLYISNATLLLNKQHESIREEDKTLSLDEKGGTQKHLKHDWEVTLCKKILDKNLLQIQR